MVTSLGVTGHLEGDADEPVLIALALPTDEVVLPGPVDQQRIEDLQIWSFLTALAIHGGLSHPVGVTPGADPPDRRLSLGTEGNLGVELTTLTATEFRRDLARMRALARAIHSALKEDVVAYGHLQDSLVVLQPAQGTVPAGDLSEQSKGILQQLKTDRGKIDFGPELPSDIPADAPGMYGRVADVIVQVYPGEAGRPLQVHGSCQLDMTLSELRRVTLELITAKDRPGNEVLVISTGLLDRAGYLCPHDQWLFAWLTEYGLGQHPPLKHTRAVFLHHFGSAEIRRLDCAESPLWPPT